ncbi:hypothetical protein [Clostridium sp.]|uniref:hypothetical protein n=1 Tax=Clostridium sp. TaxID=1506 RepID=UPI0025BB6F55|nr:hypothetical protein [Clostridium sp.]
MINKLELTRQQICDILGVAKSGLKTIENKNQLSTRLEQKGYEFINKVKVGRNAFYIIAKKNEDMELYTSICENIFNTKLYKEFGEYFMYRTYNTKEPLTRKFISEKSGVCANTVRRWDEIMVNMEILGKDGYYYIAREKLDEDKYKYRLTCKEEYNSYCKSSRLVAKRNEIKEKYIANKISLDEYTELVSAISAHWSVMEDKFVYRVSKYYLKEDKELYEDIKKLAFTTYLSQEENSKYIVTFKETI